MSEVYYVITIHGIGDQRYNETVLPVINNFGKIANKKRQLSHKDNLVTLGMVNAQTGTVTDKDGDVHFERTADQKVWAEFEGIPTDPRSASDKVFDGTESTSGENFRFVDMYWADILDADGKQSAQPVQQWTDALMGRNAQKDEIQPTQARKWLIKLLDLLREIILFLNSFLSFKGKELKEVIFNKYLSDVQVYGEHLNVRGKAVSRFHTMMEKILEVHREVNPDETPKFVFVAHSLGSIFTMDALTYAHAAASGLSGDNIPFPSYDSPNDSTKTRSYEWIDYVDTLVTLGSPIDKYLVLWWQNYRYMDLDGFERNAPKIRHINYSDEQDPVGHKLDQLRKTKSFDVIFEPVNIGHEVFNRYSIPGKAHNDYWEDEKLISNIIDNITDPEERQKNEKEAAYYKLEDKPRALLHAVTLSYFIVPLIGMIVASYFFASGFIEMLDGPCVNLDCINWGTVVSNGVAFVASSYFFHKLIKIIVYWRMILRSKNREAKKVYKSARFRGRVKFFRYLVWVILAVAFHAWGAPKLLDLSWLEAKALYKYLAIILGLYYGFLIIRRFFIPNTKIIDNGKSYIPLLLALIISIAPWTFSMNFQMEAPIFWGFNDSMLLATMLGVFIYFWTYCCVILEQAKSEIGNLLEEKDE